MKTVGYINQFSTNLMEVVEVRGSHYVLNGWNGEKYNDCWKVDKEDINNHIDKQDSYALTPQYDNEGEIIAYRVTEIF